MNEETKLQVQACLDRLILSGQEVGLQVAAYIGDELVIDAWSGVADEATGRAVDGETLFPCWSTTKGIAATCVHILADRGLIAYDTKLGAFWPEFGVEWKSDVTVRHVLMHAAGVPLMPKDVDIAMIGDWEAMCFFIAKQRPLWEPGHSCGYHAWTYGWLVGEIVRRTDGRSIGDFVREELCEVWKIGEFYLGIPDNVSPRVATLRNGNGPDVAPTELHLRVLPPQITNAGAANLAAFRRASLPAVGGIGTARAIARHYSVLANDGLVGGNRVLSAGRIDAMREFQTDTIDLVLGLPIRRGLGYCLGGGPTDRGDERMNASTGAFGHPGMGGSIGFADPARRLSFALTKTLLKTSEARTDSAAFQIMQAIQPALL